MNEKRVRDLMVPLDKYGLIPYDATLMDAASVFREAQKKRDHSRQPFRAVLVVDEDNNVMDKLAKLATGTSALGILRAMREMDDDVK